MNNSEKKNARTVAVGGVFLALSIATLFASTYIPGVELTLYAISSFYVAFVIIEASVRGGLLCYAASVILAFILVPNKMALLPYAFFFGLYAIVKYLVELDKKMPVAVEIIIKLLFFNCSFGIGIYLFKELMLGTIKLPDLAMPLLIIGAQIFFIGYDYIFTLVIGFYLKNRPKN